MSVLSQWVIEQKINRTISKILRKLEPKIIKKVMNIKWSGTYKKEECITAVYQSQGHCFFVYANAAFSKEAERTKVFICKLMKFRGQRHCETMKFLWLSLCVIFKIGIDINTDFNDLENVVNSGKKHIGAKVITCKMWRNTTKINK